MTPVTTLAAYAGVLVVVLGAAFGLGAAVGPVGPVAAPSPLHAPDHAGGPAAHRSPEAGPSAAPDPADPAAAGLAVSQDGYTLRLASSVLAASPQASLDLTISGPAGEPVTDYVRSHERELHLVVVRRDLTRYQHVHPVRGADGTWTAELDLSQPGPYKVFADAVPAGSDGLVLAADLAVPGTYAPQPLPPPAVSTSVDGYDVTLDGTLVAGTSSPVVLTVSRDGRPVPDLEPYLGAHGHLVALREGDLAYLHVHPEAEAEADEPAGPSVAFSVEVPSPATYRLFLDFVHGGAVRTAELTATAATGSPGAPAGPPPAAPHGDEDHAHETSSTGGAP